MGIEIRFFTEFTYYVFIEGVRVGTFRYFSDKGTYLFRQSDILCMSAGQLLEISKALEEFNTKQHLPTDLLDED
jgi:hypothetical protein